MESRGLRKLCLLWLMALTAIHRHLAARDVLLVNMNSNIRQGTDAVAAQAEMVDGGENAWAGRVGSP